MEIFKNKFLIKLIATLCLFLALISFGAPTKVYAAEDDDLGWGGVLITPVVKLLTAIGDGILELLHSSVQSQQISMIKIDGSTGWEKIFGWFIGIAVGILVAVAFIAATVVGGGILAALAAKVGLSMMFGTTITLGLVATSGAAGILVGTAVYEGAVPEDLYLPAFSITAEEIFSNEIPLFDINFFEPMAPQEVEKTVAKGYNEILMIQYGKGGNDTDTTWEDGTDDLDDLVQTEKNSIGDDETTGKYYRLKQQLSDKYAGTTEFYSINDIINGFNGNVYKDTIVPLLNEILNKTDNALIAKGIPAMNREHEGAKIYSSQISDENGNPIDSVMINITVPIVENPNKAEDWTRVRILFTKTIGTSTETTLIYSTANQLQGVVSQWYFILQNIALLVLMVVLIYTGIRIVLASTAGDKAKYKERLIDWIVAMCLLFVMHYIIVFAVEIVDRITDLVKNATGPNGNFAYIELTDTQSDNAKKIFEDENGAMLIEAGIAEFEGSGYKKLGWKTDLAGLFRIQSQMTDEGTGKWVGYSFSYFVLVLFTLFFAWTYLKRIVYMAFLTMIAPLVAMTYPIDKITDGKAQAFNAWLKEYIFNLLIQPMHLLLYTVLVSSAFELATDSAIYALVALGFMVPAEKLIRKFFGFEKASTPGLLGGAAGAALTMTGINKLLGHRPKGGSSGGKDSGGNESKDSAKINFKSKDAISGMKGIAGQPSGNVQLQDSEDSNIGTDKSENGGGANLRRTNSMADGDYSSDAEDIFEDMYGPDPNVSMDNGDYSSLAEDIFEGMYGPDPNVSVSGETQEQQVPEINIAEQLKKQRNEQEWNKFNQERFKTFDMNKHIKGTIASTGSYYRVLGERVKDKIENGHPIKALARGALGVVEATAFGSMGLAAGVLSGDPSKVFQYTSAGVIGGAKLGSSTVAAMQKATSVDEKYLKEQYELAAHGDEYKNYILEKEKEEMLKSEKYINYLQKTMSLSRAQAKDVLNTTGRKCIGSGITSAEDIATVHKMTQGKDAITLEEAIGAKKFNDLLPSDVSKMSSKKRGEYITTWTEDYKKAGYGAESENHAKKSMEYAIKFADTQSSLKKSQV